METLIATLLEKGLITREQLDDARDKQIGAKKPLQELFVEMGFMTEEELLVVASQVFNTPIYHLEEDDVEREAVGFLPYEKAKLYGVFPVKLSDEKLVVAMTNTQDVIALDDLNIITKKKIKPVLSLKSDIAAFTDKFYQSDESIYDLLKNVVVESKVEVVEEESPAETEPADLMVMREMNSPIVRLVNLIFSDALKSHASDIHIEPQEKETIVRYRVDGDLKVIMKVPSSLHSGVVVRVKIMSALNIAESRKSQDGRAEFSVDGKKIDVRISIIPTIYGEKVVMRLLDPRGSQLDIGSLGFSTEDLKIFTECILRSQGMILVTGPTGSGKTSTLYAGLNFIKDESKNIMTIEDPVEYLIAGISQIQVEPAKDVTFSTGLRSILRQDPNVVLVGEIRDQETAEIAFRASLTGHIVFSTIHTNSAVSTVTRLVDIGIEPYLIASSVSLITAQRLVRVICPHCKEKYTPHQDLINRFKLYIDKYSVSSFYKGRGCERCGYSGFSGRTTIAEMLPVDESIRKLITSEASEDDIFHTAIDNGMLTLAESGMQKVAEGITTLEELSKACEVVEVSAVEVAQPEEKREKSLLVIADDEEDILKMLEKRLVVAGYDVIKAVNGQEAVEFAIKEKPDLVITDIMMPVKDGFEVVKELRSRLETSLIPIIMLTAKKDKESELAGIDAGADDYITKPFDKDKLLARIKMLLRRRGH